MCTVCACEGLYIGDKTDHGQVQALGQYFMPTLYPWGEAQGQTGQHIAAPDGTVEDGGEGVE